MRLEFSDLSVFLATTETLGFQEARQNILMEYSHDLGQLVHVLSLSETPLEGWVHPPEKIYVFQSNDGPYWTAIWNEHMSGRGLDRVIGPDGRNLRVLYTANVLKKTMNKEKVKRAVRMTHSRGGTNVRVLSFGKTEPLAIVHLDEKGRLLGKKVFGPGCKFRRITTTLFDRERMLRTTEELAQVG